MFLFICEMVLVVGFEPTTIEVRIPCSTIELHEHKLVRAEVIETSSQPWQGRVIAIRPCPHENVQLA